jgi:fission process protein 1
LLSRASPSLRRAAGTKVRAQQTDNLKSLTEAEKEACVAEELVAEDAEVDIWRDTPVRYLGYANECGEALRAFLPAGGVPATYALAIGYVLADTVDKALKEWKISAKCKTDPSNSVRSVRVAATSIDALTWQMLASVFVPGSVIHLIVAATTRALESIEPAHDAAAAVAMALPLDVSADAVLAGIPTAVGLLTIPFIVEPIDETIHKVCDASVRPAMTATVNAYSRSDKGEPAPEDAAFDGGAVAKGALALGAALAFPPTLFTLGGLIEGGGL